MLVRANENFKKYKVFPKELGFIPDYGYIFKVPDERYEMFSGKNPYNVSFVEKIEIDNYHVDKRHKRANKISIIIPNCNYEDTIERCINSILNQTYKNYEIIFVDDVSSDKSLKIAKSLLQKPHKVIQLKQKRYAGGSRNEGLIHISNDSDYIFNIDSDDWLFNEDVLMKINDSLYTSPDVLFMGIVQYKNKKYYNIPIKFYENIYEAFEGWSGCGKVVRKELAVSQECLYNEGTLKEDKNQHCRLCIHMDDFKVLDEYCYVWNRDNKKSVTTIRDNIKWKTSTIRHYADAQELYLTYKGQDSYLDQLMEQRLKKIKQEIYEGGTRQF